MALIRDRVGDNFDDYLYSSKKNIAEYAKQLQASGYIPNENEGLLDSLQSGLWGGLGGLLGGASALAKEQGWDGIANWTGNEAQYAGNRAQANAYTGKWEEGNYLNYALNQGAQALGSSVPSLIGDIATTAAIGSVAGGPVGTALGAVVGAGKWANRLYEGSKLVQYGAKAGKFATGVVAGGLIENATNAGDTYMTGLQRGMDHNQSYDAMKTTFNEGWAPAMANYAFDKISMQGSLGSGITGAFATGGGKVLAKGAVATAVNAGVGAVGEAVTEAWQQQIQEKALGTPEYKNVNIYDPTSWTQDMKDQAFDAGVGSIPLGLISGTFSSGKTLSQKEREKKNQLALEQAEQAMNATPTLGENPVTTTPSEEGGDVDLGETTPTVMPEAPSTDGENASLDLSEETPEHMVERPRDELDDAFDGLNHAHYKKQGKSDDDILEMNNNARATTEMIHQKWEEHTPEAKYSPNAFVPDFREQGYTEKDARKLSRATVEMYEKKQPKESSNEPTLVERAESIGYNLSDEDKESINNGTMPKAIMGSIEKNIITKEKEVAETREQERKVQEENQKREEYNNHYKDSVNKGFLEETFREVPDGPNKDQLIRDTGYAIREATSEYNKEHTEYENGKRDKTPVGLKKKLAQKGITPGNTYTKEQFDNIVEHVNDIQKIKGDSPTTTKGELRKRGFENASLGKIDNAFGNRRTKNKINVKAEKNDKRFENFYLDEANKLIETAKATGLPVERSKTYKAIRDKSTQGFKNIQNALFPKVEAPKKEKSVQEQLFTPIKENDNSEITIKPTKKQAKRNKQLENARKLQEAKARLAEEENKKTNKPQKEETITDEDLAEIQKEQEEDRQIEEYENKQKEKNNENNESEEADDDWTRQAEEDAQKEKETREAFEEKEDNKDHTSEEVDKELEEDEDSEEFFKNHKEKENKEDKIESNTEKEVKKYSGKVDVAHKVFDRYLSGELDAKTAKIELMGHEMKASKKNAKYIQALKESIDYYEGKDEKARKDANNQNKIAESLANIEKFIGTLKKDLEGGKLDNKAFEDRAKAIRKRIKDLFIKHPETLKTFSDIEDAIPKQKPVTKSILLDRVEDGSVKLTNTIIKSLLVRPGELKTSLTKWVRNKLNEKSVNLNKQDINRVIVKIMEDEYESIVDKYGSLDEALTDTDGNHRVRVFFRAVAGLFPDEHFHPTMTQHQERRREALGLSKQGLDPSSKKGDLLKYKDLAKTYFREEFDPKNKDMEFVNATNIASQQKPKKLDLSKNKNIKPAITLKSIEDLGEDSFKFTLEYDKSKGWTARQIREDYANIVAPYTDNMFISDEVNNVEVNEENGTITFEAEPFLSGKNFSGKLESDTNTDDKKTALQGRMMVVESAIETSPDKVISFSVDKKHESVVQNYLDRTFGEGKYKILDSGESTEYITEENKDGEIVKEKNEITKFYIYSLDKYPTEESLKKAMENDSFYYPIYQKGNDNGTIGASTSDISVIRKLANNSQVNQDKPSEAEMKQILGGIEKAFGEHSKDVLDFLNEVEGLSIRVFDEDEPSQFDMNTGELFIRRDRLGGTATAHELVHVAVESYLTNTDGKNKLIKILENTTKSLEEELYGNDRLETTNQIGSGTRGMSEGNLRGNDQLRDVGNNARTQTQSNTSGAFNEDSDTKGMSSQSGEGRRSGSGSLGRSSLQETREYTRDDRTPQMVPREETGRPRERDGLLRAWDSAKTELESVTTKLELQKKQKEMIERIRVIIGRPDMDVNDKSILLLRDFWLANELGKKFNENMLGAIYKGKDTTNLHETLAYGLQNGLAPVHAGALFNGAKEHVEELSKILTQNINKNYGTEYAAFIHTTSVPVVLANLKRGYGINVSAAGNTLINTGHDSDRGTVRFLMDPEATQAESEIKGGNDISTSSTFENSKEDKYEGRLTTRRNNAYAAITSVLANYVNSLDDVKKSLKGREGNFIKVEKFSHNLIKKLDEIALQMLKGDKYKAERDDLTNRIQNNKGTGSLHNKLFGENGVLEPVVETLYKMEKEGVSAEEASKGIAKFSKNQLEAIEELRNWVKENEVIPYTEHRVAEFSMDNVPVIILTKRAQTILNILKNPEGRSKELLDEIKEEVEGIDELLDLAKKEGKEVWIEPQGLTPEKLGEWLTEKVKDYNKEHSRKISFQKGKESTQVAEQKQPTEAEKQSQKEEQEAKEQPILSAGKRLVREVSKKAGIKTPDNIEIINRDTRSGNISGWGLKKWFVSPIRMIQKYIPQAGAIIKWAEKAENDQTKLMQTYYRLFDKMKQTIGDKSKEFEKLTREINELGRDFVQTVAVNHNGKEYYVNLTNHDIFEEYMDEASAKERYKELKNDGYKVFMDFKENKWRVLASDTGLKTIGSYSDAKQKARTATIQAIKDKGYSKEVAYAYNHWITLREKIYNDKVQAWKDSGQDEDQRPKLLWGYTPSLHGKYGVYKVKTVRDDENGEYRQYDKIASFKTQKDAMEYASQFANDGNSYSIVEHGSRFDDARTASAIYEDSYDPSYDTILEELESPEDINKRFERISHSYPMIAKIIDEFITKGKGLNREQFIDLLEDKEKLADLGIDKKQLQEERKHANLDELFRLKPTVGKLDIQKHLLINYGNHMRDKFNQTRMNAQGANPDVLGNMEDYIRYNARYIPTSVFYYKSTALYRDITGHDYKSQFGRGGEGAQNDYQEILNNFIGSVVGLPNGVDKMLNQVFNDVFGKTWVKAMFGEKAVTDALGFSMQTVTVLKLGMFRPTAAIAQLGTLMNITTFSGFNKLTAQAMRDASLYSGNVSLSEKKMFNRIGLNREDTALETQALMNEKSIYNMNIKGLPIGKFLEKSMFMFNATDKYTRRVAALVAYRQAIADGKTPEEATDIARDFVRKTNFDYSDKDAPQLFTKLGSIGKLLFQFKKYPVKEAELMMELFQSGDKKAIARFFGQYLVMAGMMGVPVAGAGDELAEWITGTSPTKEMKKLVMEWAGNDPNKKSLALVAMYGVPALAGVDFSRNIGLGDLVPTNGLEGPTLSTISNVYKAFRDHEGANNIMSNIAKELSPAYANYYQALTGRKRDWNKDVDTRNYSTGERVAKGLGFRPVSDSVEYDTYSIVKDKQDEEKAKKQKLINKYLDDPKSVTKKELHQAGVKGADIRRAQENLKKTKTEKALSNMPKKKETESKRTARVFTDFEEDL